MIQFRCWYCNRYWRKPPAHVHSKFACCCGNLVRIPKRDWRSSKPWSFTNWLIGAVVYGAGMGLLSFFFAFLVFGRNPAVLTTFAGWALLGVFGLLGVLIGVIGGERGIERIMNLPADHLLAILRSGAGNPGG